MQLASVPQRITSSVVNKMKIEKINQIKFQ